MSTNDWDDEFDETDDEPKDGPKALRAALRKEKERAKELAETLQQVQKDLRQRAIKDVIAAKGVNPKIASLVPRDVEGDEAIEKWLDDYADVFGLSAQSDEANIDVGEVSEHERAAAAASGDSPTPSKDAFAQINSASNDEELRAALIAAGLV